MSQRAEALADHIALLQEQISALTAERDELRAYLSTRPTTLEHQEAIAERDRLRQALEAVEWVVGLGCPNCHQFRDSGHADDCIVGLALEGGK